MIVKGNSRSNGAFWAKHLLNAEENERVSVVEMKGLYADDVKEAFREMRLLAAGTRADKPYYIVSMNPREDERLTPEQWDIAVERLEAKLGLTDHARLQVEHEKEGRTYRHIIWSRVDVDSMTVVPTTNNYYVHAETARELEQLFDHEPTPVPPAPEADFLSVMTSSAVIRIVGRNLKPIATALKLRTCDTITQYSPEFFLAPTDTTAPFVEAVEVTTPDPQPAKKRER